MASQHGGDVKTPWERLARPRMSGLRELPGCYYRTGRWSRARLFLATYEDGAHMIVYPVYIKSGSVVYVDVARVDD